MSDIGMFVLGFTVTLAIVSVTDVILEADCVLK